MNCGHEMAKIYGSQCLKGHCDRDPIAAEAERKRQLILGLEDALELITTCFAGREKKQRAAAAVREVLRREKEGM